MEESVRNCCLERTLLFTSLAHWLRTIQSSTQT
uniref:Uncharacterized protein n=2 Tax=unclassified Caudoviricetes TaxID=2788787 RepID=A0AAU8HYE7_9CAUD